MWFFSARLFVFKNVMAHLETWYWVKEKKQTQLKITIKNKNYLKEKKKSDQVKDLWWNIQHGLCFPFKFTSITHHTIHRYDIKNM